MPTRNVSLTAEQDLFVERLVDSGEYQNASEAIRDGLRVLQQRRREDTLKLRALRAHVQEGIDGIDRGDHVELDLGAIDGYLRGLTSEAPRSARRKPRR